MAKGAALETKMGGLHSLLATVFEKTLQKYMAELEAVDKLKELDTDDLEGELAAAALLAIGEPNPAMLSAVSKFLKDNDIGMDSEEVDQLNSTQRRLDEAKAKRKAKGLNLSVVPHVEAG